MKVENLLIDEINKSSLNPHIKNIKINDRENCNCLYGNFFIDGYLFLPIEHKTLTTSLDTLGTSVFGSSGKGMLIGGIGFLLVGISVLGMIFNVTQAVTPAMVLGIPLVMAGVVLGVIPMALAFITFFFVLMLFGLTFLMSRLA